MPILTQQVSVSEDWHIDESDTKPASLIVQQRRAAHVLPWFRFVYAEGDDARVQLVFSSHLVTVNGHGLIPLLAAISAHRVVRLIQPTGSEANFSVRGNTASDYRGPGITSITVQKFE
jgi:hypothetical protein